MKAKRIAALMIASMFSGALAVGTTAGAGGMGSSDATGSSGATEDWTSFNKLDQNGDGRISQQEADANPALAEHFKRLDNNNDQLDQGEFAQFETMGRGMHRDGTKQDKGRGLDLHES